MLSRNNKQYGEGTKEPPGNDRSSRPVQSIVWPSRLLLLPYELRDMIWVYVFTSPNGIRYSPEPRRCKLRDLPCDDPPSGSLKNDTISLRLVCRSIYRETFLHHLILNTLIFRTPGERNVYNRGTSNISRFLGYLKTCYPIARTVLREIVIHDHAEEIEKEMYLQGLVELRQVCKWNPSFQVTVRVDGLKTIIPGFSVATALEAMNYKPEEVDSLEHFLWLPPPQLFSGASTMMASMKGQAPWLRQEIREPMSLGNLKFYPEDREYDEESWKKWWDDPNVSRRFQHSRETVLERVRKWHEKGF